MQLKNKEKLKMREVENANWWAIHGEHGTSSKTIFNHLCKKNRIRELHNDDLSTPSDPDDFKRCYKLLNAVPQWKKRMNELKTISSAWKRFVDNWAKLTTMYEKNIKENWKNYKKIGMYEFMCSLKYKHERLSEK